MSAPTVQLQHIHHPQRQYFVSRPREILCRAKCRQSEPKIANRQLTGTPRVEEIMLV